MRRDRPGGSRLSRTRASTLVATAATLVALTGPAQAEARSHWPTPAAGESQSGDPEVVFTFDDGPHEKWSAQILDALAAHHVRATFFWVGRRVEGDRAGTNKRRALVARAVREGHVIGNHTVHHLHLCHASSDITTEIEQNDALYEALAELPIVLFRTPYGDRCPRLLDKLDGRGLTHLHWDIDPREYRGLSGESTARFIISELRRLNGRAVVLMHDTHQASARAVPIILDWIEAENRRRQESGRRPIRIVSGSDLVGERARSPLWLWGEGAAIGARGWLGHAMTSLVPGAPTGRIVVHASAPAGAGAPPSGAAAGPRLGP